MNTINPSAASQGATVHSRGAQSTESDRVASAMLLRRSQPASMRSLLCPASGCAAYRSCMPRPHGA